MRVEVALVLSVVSVVAIDKIVSYYYAKSMISHCVNLSKTLTSYRCCEHCDKKEENNSNVKSDPVSNSTV